MPLLPPLGIASVRARLGPPPYQAAAAAVTQSDSILQPPCLPLAGHSPLVMSLPYPLSAGLDRGPVGGEALLKDGAQSICIKDVCMTFFYSRGYVVIVHGSRMAWRLWASADGGLSIHTKFRGHDEVGCASSRLNHVLGCTQNQRQSNNSKWTCKKSFILNSFAYPCKKMES